MAKQQMIHGFQSSEDVDRVRDVTLAVESANPDLKFDRTDRPKLRVQFKLTTDLDGTDDPDVPTSATGKIRGGLRDSDALGDVGEDVKIYNRFPSGASAGDLIIAVEFDHDDKLYMAKPGGDGCSCCEFDPDSDITLSDGKNSRSVYPIDITEAPGRLVTAGNAKLWLSVYEYHLQYNLLGDTNADGREGWYTPFSVLQAKVYATHAITGEALQSGSITNLTAKLYVVYKNLHYEGDEPKTTLHIELDATVDETLLEIPPPPPP